MGEDRSLHKTSRDVVSGLERHLGALAELGDSGDSLENFNSSINEFLGSMSSSYLDLEATEISKINMFFIFVVVVL